ncbi:MAG: hypothetical protein FWD17_06625 [Polyangiaceae bacterium]|nr:hypothetical protein [Polyangiaceae bacterium]
MVGALLVVVGCGGRARGAPESASGSVTGTFDGNPIPTNSVVAVKSSENGVFAVAVIFVNIANACSVLQSGNRPPNLADLQLVVEGTGEAGTGAFAITSVSNTVTVAALPGDGGAAPMSQPMTSSDPYATVTFGKTDANCMTTTYDSEASGSFTLTTVTSSEVAGRFDVTFSGGDHVTGSFDAPVCNLPSGGTTTTTTTCGG